MWTRGGVRSSALDRAKAQLSGKRVTSSGELRQEQSRDVNASFGKTLQSRQIPLHGLSDLSSDDENEKHDYDARPARTVPQFPEQFPMGGGSRFLKTSVNRQSSPADTNEGKLIPQRGSQSMALSRLSLIEERIKNHTNKLAIDTGEDISSGLSVQSNSELSAADGSRFLKKKVSTPKHDMESERPHVDIYMVPAHSVSCMQKGVSLDSDEEDMRRLLGESFESPDEVKGMRLTETSPQQGAQTYRKRSKVVIMRPPEHKEKQPILSAFTAWHHKSPSPSPASSRKASSPSRLFSQRADLSSSLSSAPDHSEIRSLEELFPITSNHDDTQSERSVLSDDFKLNVMTLDDLAHDTLDRAGLSKEKSNTSPQELSVPSVGEILHNTDDERVRYVSDFESEIQTETAHTVDDISEHLFSGNEHSFVASEPQSLSANSNSDNDYTVSEKPSKSVSVHDSSFKSSLSHSKGSDSLSYTSDATLTHTRPQSHSVRGHMKDATVQTQAEGLAYIWSSDQALLGPSVGMSYTDPTPVASHTISAEALEALTAYSPAVFALNDMLRQQLTLTRTFIQSIRHVHQVMLESLGPANYRYTTLEDTKEYIRSKRPPRLSKEDALEDVLQEMRDYHYI